MAEDLTNCDALVVSTSSRRVLVVSDSQLVEIDGESGKELKSKNIGPYDQIAFSLDGSRVALVQDGVLSVLDTASADVIARVNVVESAGAIENVAISADGTLVVTVAGYNEHASIRFSVQGEGVLTLWKVD